jgi:GT2 family glycosyltransferase
MMHEPKSVIYHKISKSSGGDLSPFVLFWSTKNRRKFKNKFAYKVSSVKMIKFNIMHFVTRIIRIFIYLVKGEKEKSKAIWKGLFA